MPYISIQCFGISASSSPWTIPLIALVTAIVTAFLTYLFNFRKDKKHYHLKLRHDMYLKFFKAVRSLNSTSHKDVTDIKKDNTDFSDTMMEMLLLGDKELINLYFGEHSSKSQNELEIVNLIRKYFGAEKLSEAQKEKLLKFIS